MISQEMKQQTSKGFAIELQELIEARSIRSEFERRAVWNDSGIIQMIVERRVVFRTTMENNRLDLKQNV